AKSAVLTKRQQQMFSVRKRSANEATATNVFCAKSAVLTKRQQQMFSV
ncbi:hypothetical protein ABH968_002534, partial [Lysinibacillus sp. RC79]